MNNQIKAVFVDAPNHSIGDGLEIRDPLPNSSLDGINIHLANKNVGGISSDNVATILLCAEDYNCLQLAMSTEDKDADSSWQNTKKIMVVFEATSQPAKSVVSIHWTYLGNPKSATMGPKSSFAESTPKTFSSPQPQYAAPFGFASTASGPFRCGSCGSVPAVDAAHNNLQLEVSELRHDFNELKNMHQQANVLMNKMLRNQLDMQKQFQLGNTVQEDCPPLQVEYPSSKGNGSSKGKGKQVPS